MKMKATYLGPVAAAFLAASVFVIGCGDDDGDTTATTTAATSSSSSSGGEGGSMTSSSSSSSGGNGGTAAQGGAGMGGAGTGGGDLAAEAAAFCVDYEMTCGFGEPMYFASKEDCVDDYTKKFDAARRECVKTHLGLAASNAKLHCPHAAGQAPCN